MGSDPVAASSQSQPTSSCSMDRAGQEPGYAGLVRALGLLLPTERQEVLQHWEPDSAEDVCPAE